MDIVLMPGQQFSLEAETVLSGSITIKEYKGTTADAQAVGEGITAQK